MKKLFKIGKYILAGFASMASISAAASDLSSLRTAQELGQKGRTGSAIAITERLQKNSKELDPNMVSLTLGRLYYQKGDLKKAIEIYDGVSKTSDYWPEAQEEKAWAYTRKADYDKALSALKSLFTSVFVPSIGPETYMLSAYVNYKICDYKAAYDKILEFKKQMQDRAKSLEKISQNPERKLPTKWLAKMQEKLEAGKTLNAADLGNDINELPKYFYHDAGIMAALQKKNTSAANAIMKALAKKDLAEIVKNLNKMKIIEVEIIQRSFNYDSKLATGDLSFDKEKTSKTLVFPVEKDSQEVWLDEIGKYQVKIQKCPTAQGGRS